MKIFVRRLDPKDPRADRGRAVGRRSRAIAGTFVAATCADRAHVRNHVPLYLDKKLWGRTRSSDRDRDRRNQDRQQRAKLFDTYVRTSPRATPGSNPEQHIATSSDDERFSSPQHREIQSRWHRPRARSRHRRTRPRVADMITLADIAYLPLIAPRAQEASEAKRA